MFGCNFIEICLFFNDELTENPLAVASMKKTYCKWNYAKCARYKVATVLGIKKMPSDLYPGDSLRAEEILGQQRKK